MADSGRRRWTRDGQDHLLAAVDAATARHPVIEYQRVCITEYPAKKNGDIPRMTGSTDTVNGLFARLFSHDPAVRDQAVTRLWEVYPELKLEDVELLFDLFVVLEIHDRHFYPDIIAVIGKVAAEDPELIPPRVIKRIFIMLNAYQRYEYTDWDATVLETIHIILYQVLEAQGPDAVEPAIFPLADHLQTEQWTEWGDKVVLQWLAANARPGDFMNIVDFKITAGPR